MKPLLPIGIAFLALLADVRAPAEDAPSPLLRSGDRVALIGNTVIERARLYGHLEAALQLAAGREVEPLSFRNLGWSADSVYGDARSYFGPPKEGRERLNEIVARIEPTVVLLCYGAGAATSVEQGWTREPDAAEASGAGLEPSLEVFVEGYRQLIARVRGAAGSPLREVVLIAPPPLENLGDPLPDHVETNERLAVFRDAIRDLAKDTDARFVDWFAALGGDAFDSSVADPALTHNGMHYTEAGYRVLARELAKGLGYEENHTLLAENRSALREFRAAIVEKNRLFFHRWRPANETYLFLFRKHEQGENAKEIPKFDPLVRKQEARIAEVRNRVFAGPGRE